MRTKTVGEYNRHLNRIKEIVLSIPWFNLEETWLMYKDHFVAAFVCDTLYLGHTITSRVESGHAAFKSWITVSTGDLMTMESACQLASNNQLANIRLQTGR